MDPVQPQWAGRLGNNLWQRYFAVLGSVGRGVAASVPPGAPAWSEPLWAAKDVPADTELVPPVYARRDKRYSFDWNNIAANWALYAAHIREPFRRCVLTGGVEPSDAPEIVIHVRSGDVWRRRHPHYPIISPAFYEVALQRIAALDPTAKNAVLVTQDDNCATRWLASRMCVCGVKVRLSGGDLRKDLALFMRAKHIVLSPSTMALHAALASNNLRTLHVPVVGLFRAYPSFIPQSMEPWDVLQYDCGTVWVSCHSPQRILVALARCRQEAVQRDAPSSS